MNDKLLYTLLNDQEVYRRIISKIISSSYIPDDIALINQLNDYIINNKEELNETSLKKYITFLYDIFKINNNIIFKLDIFKHKELFTKPQILIINDARIKMSNKVHKISLNFIEGKEIKKDDLYLLLDFFNSNMDNENITNFIDTIYSYLLNNYKEEYNQYIINYTSYLASKIYNTDYVRIYYSNTMINNCETITYKDDLKYINRITNIIYDVIKIVKKHSTKKTKLEEFELLKDRLFKEYLNPEEYKEYKNNYKHNEIDYYNNTNIWLTTISILKKYSSCLYQELNNIKNDSLIKYYYRTIYIKEDKLYHKEKYNVDILDEIVSEHPEVIDDCPILNNIYNKNGSKKGIREILTNEYNLNEKYLFNDYFTEYIQTGNLNKIDINKIDLEYKFLLISKITVLLKIELNELLNNLKLYKLLDKDDIRFISRVNEYNSYNFNRVNKIRYYINYINDNEELINNLIEIDTKEYNYKINKDINEVIKYFKNVKNKINDKHSDDIKSLSEVTIYGE